MKMSETYNKMFLVISAIEAQIQCLMDEFSTDDVLDSQKNRLMQMNLLKCVQHLHSFGNSLKVYQHSDRPKPLGEVSVVLSTIETSKNREGNLLQNIAYQDENNFCDEKENLNIRISTKLYSNNNTDGFDEPLVDLIDDFDSNVEPSIKVEDGEEMKVEYFGEFERKDDLNSNDNETLPTVKVVDENNSKNIAIAKVISDSRNSSAIAVFKQVPKDAIQKVPVATKKPKKKVYARPEVELVNKGPPYICDICGKERCSFLSLKHHTAIHYYPKIPCPKCGKLFIRQNKLAIHIEQGLCSKEHKERKFKCVVCYSHFKTEDALKNHLETKPHKKFACDQCEFYTFRKNEYESHKICHSEERPFSCDICGVTFKTKQGLESHKNFMHIQNQPASCEICAKVLKNEKCLKIHMEVHSDAIFRHHCEICGKSFRWKNNLTRHQRRHADAAPYKCTVCNKAYKDPQTLRNHAAVHDKENHFKCKLCSRTFSFVSALNRHLIRVHKILKNEDRIEVSERAQGV